MVVICCHIMVVMLRPRWVINVPILFLLSGHCALGRPLKEIAQPLMVTNIYITFCWMALVTSSGYVKWALIVASLCMYGWASMDMMRWSSEFHRTAPADLPSRSVRPWLSNGLIIHFQVYAAIYLSSTLGVFNADQELTFGTTWHNLPPQFNIKHQVLSTTINPQPLLAIQP